MPSIISSAAVASLALGIGGALAMFTLVNSVLLRPLAVDRPHELATLSTVAAAQDRRTEMFSYATFEDIRRRGLFDGVLTWTLSSVNVESESQPVSAMWVSGDAFQILGVRASIGRSLVPADDAAGGGRDGPVAMISHRLWQRRFNRSPAVIGSSLMVERTPVTIVGVTPPDFHGVELGRPFDLFLPMQTGALIEPAQVLGPHDPYLWIMLRLARGQSLDAATAALRTSQAAIRLASLPPRGSAAEFLQDPFMLESASGGTSVYALRQQYSRSAADAARPRHDRARGRLRQRRQPAPRSRHRAAHGDGDPAGARRLSMGTRETPSAREPRARDGRRGPGTRVRDVGEPRAGRAHAHRRSAVDAGPVTRLAHGGLHRRADDGLLRLLRRRPCTAQRRGSRRSTRSGTRAAIRAAGDEA